MEQADQIKTIKDKVHKRRRSQAKYYCEVINIEDNTTVENAGGLQKSSISLLNGCDRRGPPQEPAKDQRRKRREDEKNVTGKQMKARAEIKGLNTEKSAKDLQRCTVSLNRYRVMIKEEMENSIRNIKATFAELHKSIIDREAELTSEVEKVKGEALETLMSRQNQAQELKRLAELSCHMAGVQLSELRVQIKHFVGERKHDEELSKSARISCDTEQLKRQILVCGEISHPKNSYSIRTSSSSGLSSEVHRVTAPKCTVHRQRVRKQSTRNKDYGKFIAGTETASDIPTEQQEPAAQQKWSTKQAVESTQRRRFVPKRPNARLNEHVKAPILDNGAAQNANSDPDVSRKEGSKTAAGVETEEL
ncbi:SPATS2-like protein [Ascaphus truei]|uniref:SPATS2-like protein n=1 Tax=Ascaphus truei TaxID=8439 RepID=UPI003F59E3B1